MDGPTISLNDPPTHHASADAYLNDLLSFNDETVVFPSSTSSSLSSSSPYSKSTNLRSLGAVDSRGWSLLDANPDPQSRRSHSMAAWGDDKIVVSFGFHSSASMSFSSLSDVWSYEVSTGAWELLSQEPAYKRGSHLSAVVGDKLHIYGGLKYTNTWSTDATSTLYTLDLTTRSWSTATSTSSVQPRGEAVGGMWEGRLWIYGGLQVGQGASNVAALGDVRSVHVETGEWDDGTVQVTSLVQPPARFSHAGSIDPTTGNLCTTAGRALKSNGDWYILNDAWCLDLRTYQWRELPLVNPITRSYHTLTSWKGGLYQFGGYKTSTTPDGRDVAYVFSDLNILQDWQRGDDTWMNYDPNNSTSETKNPAVRFQHTALASGPLYTVFGGRFQTTDDSRGFNGLNLTLIKGYDLAPAEVEVDPSLPGLDEATHLVVAGMVVVGLIFLALAGAVRRRGGIEGGGGPGALLRGPGLTQREIDAIPKFTFDAPNSNNFSNPPTTKQHA
mmetsp:Transcript_12308/g.25083  ORF Transcript_12308/g.25083 Transcript_12308/m.25083 type:complete len:500 (+) Transcript_12308:358-1857(+)